jgi:hypothetical protein
VEDVITLAEFYGKLLTSANFLKWLLISEASKLIYSKSGHKEAIGFAYEMTISRIWGQREEHPHLAFLSLPTSLSVGRSTCLLSQVLDQPLSQSLMHSPLLFQCAGAAWAG